jgi:hypothetical protein
MKNILSISIASMIAQGFALARRNRGLRGCFKFAMSSRTG